MSTKKKNARSAARAVNAPTAASETALPLELISTAQVKIVGGASVTWTALRSVGAKPSDQPAFFINTLPGNAPAGTPSSYALRSIAVQARFFEIELTATDRDVVYFVTPPTGVVQRMPVSRGAIFMVPMRISDEGVTKVDLTFDGECCTIRAVPKPLVPPAGGMQGAPAMLMDGDGDGDIPSSPLP